MRLLGPQVRVIAGSQGEGTMILWNISTFVFFRKNFATQLVLRAGTWMAQYNFTPSYWRSVTYRALDTSSNGPVVVAQQVHIQAQKHHLCASFCSVFFIAHIFGFINHNILQSQLYPLFSFSSWKRELQGPQRNWPWWVYDGALSLWHALSIFEMQT